MEISHLTWDKIWERLLAECLTGEEHRRWAAHLDVKEVVVQKQAGSWRIVLSGPEDLPQETRQKIMNYLSNYLSRLVPTTCEYCGDKPSVAVTNDWEYYQRLQEFRHQQAAAAEGLFGRPFQAESVTLDQVEHSGDKVTVLGKVIAVDSRELRNSKTLLTFDLTDYTDSITVKLIGDDEVRALVGSIKKGQWLTVSGVTEVDQYLQEIVLSPKFIDEAEPPVDRVDQADEKRVELHFHTKMSAMDGLVDVEEAVALAASWGHKAIAITDHGVVQAFPEAFSARQKYRIKIIYGMEGYLCAGEEEPEFERTHHILILVRNQAGLKNLYKLVSQSHLEHFYRHPRLSRQLLEKHREGLLLGSACENGELFQAILAGQPEEKLLEVASFYDFLEIQPLGNNDFLVREGRASLDQLKEYNRTICRLGEILGKPVVATGDVHFLRPRDEVYRRILMYGQGYSDAEKQAPLYFRTTEEMLAEFEYLGEDLARKVVIESPNQIADMVEEVIPVPQEFCGPQLPGSAEEIRRLTMETAHKLYGSDLPEIVQKRLERELDSIINNGFAELYMIAHKLVQKSLSDGYLVGSRGSVGSSLVATMSKITEVNPLPPHYLCPKCQYSQFITNGSVNSGVDLPDADCPRCGAKLLKEGHDIPFETFLGFNGDKVPDIDLNFSGEYQPVVHKYTEELFGEGHVFRAGTIATLADRTAYGFVRKYLDEKGIKKRRAEINRLVQGCTGVKRTTGQHPGGLMIVPKDRKIFDFTPIQHPANDAKSGTITTHFDYKAISSRLVKLDILGHDDPTVLRMLQDITGVRPQSIPLDDKETMAIFSGLGSLGLNEEELGSKVGTLGVPEFGTRFVRQMLEETRPKTFGELVRISGLSHGTDVWLNNAQEWIHSGQASLAEVISTRDDIMTHLLLKGVDPLTSFKIMEKVRKGKGITPEDVEVMKKAGVAEWFIESCRRIKYLFPKAHAVAYVTMAFRIAWFKVHYPEAFYATYFTVRADEFDVALVAGGLPEVNKTIKEYEAKGNSATAREKNILTILEVVREALLRGITFGSVDLYKSDATAFKIAGKKLIPPFISISGLGESAAESIVTARAEGAFTSVEDLRSRTGLSKTLIEVLKEQGTIGNLPETNQMNLFAF
ncbi:MAG: PolC-type DNA polymerase III [Firmicutes bacterium]|nr:PolC-type DNA polymerase III [Bacillota bacterium]